MPAALENVPTPSGGSRADGRTGVDRQSALDRRPRANGHAEAIEVTVTAPEDTARYLLTRLELAVRASLLGRAVPAADAFVPSRLGSDWRPGHGTLRGVDHQAVVDHARLDGAPRRIRSLAQSGGDLGDVGGHNRPPACALVPAGPMPVPPPPFQREIRSARYPHGLPDRCDDTVVEAFDDAWLLLERTGSGYRVLGVAQDYEAARAWLVAVEDATGS